MTKDESHHRNAPFPEESAHWLRVMAEEEAADRQRAAAMQGNAPSPSETDEDAKDHELDDCLKQAVQEGLINLDELVERAKRDRAAANRQTMTRRLAVTGTMMMGALVVGVALFHDVAATHVTEKQTRSILLEDGSSMVLNMESTVQVKYTEDARELYLVGGEGLFKVRKDPRRPFRVHAGKAMFEAVGTQFDVRVADGAAKMAVVEGVVKLEAVSSAPSGNVPLRMHVANITQGLSVSVDAEGRAEAPKPIDVAAFIAWHTGEYVFDGESLEQIAAALSRHEAMPRLIIEGEALRKRPFNMSVKATNPEELLQYLEKVEGLSLTHHGNEVIVREPTP